MNFCYFTVKPLSYLNLFYLFMNHIHSKNRDQELCFTFLKGGSDCKDNGASLWEMVTGNGFIHTIPDRIKAHLSSNKLCSTPKNHKSSVAVNHPICSFSDTRRRNNDKGNFCRNILKVVTSFEKEIFAYKGSVDWLLHCCIETAQYWIPKVRFSHRKTVIKHLDRNCRQIVTAASGSCLGFCFWACHMPPSPASIAPSHINLLLSMKAVYRYTW